MRSFIFILIGLVVLAGIYTFLPSCKQDKGPIIIEPCFCDTSEYKDPNCPCDQDKTPPPCLCDTTSYLDINCPCDKDSIPYPLCPCDTSHYLDPLCSCDRDTIPHPGWCWCDTSDYKDPKCPCDQDTMPFIVFTKHIQPIFEKYCLVCHFEGSGLNNYSTADDTYFELKYGGYYRIGRPDDSKLIQMIKGKKPEMPPEPPLLTEWDFKLIYYWIYQGAVFM
jgi:hypothetical protein